MEEYAKPIRKLIDQLSRLPGVGKKSAQRLAYFILDMDINEATEFATSIIAAKEKIRFCSICSNLTEINPCLICKSESRDKTKICVIESPRDLLAMEKTNEYKGQYHVLRGALNPMKDIGPGDLTIKTLLERLNNDIVSEIIVATNPTVEGEATAVYLSKLIHPLGIKVTRIAHGIPVGGDLDYFDPVTLSLAMANRREI